MRFVKLELTWYASEWLLVLSGNARLCWVMLLCYAKGQGQAGRVKRLAPEIAARLWFVGEEDVRKMELAAAKNGAIAVEDGDWIVANWHKYQGDETGADRQRRFRESKTGAECNGSNALRPLRNVEEKRGEEKRGEYNPPTPLKKGGGRKAVFSRPTQDEVFDYGKEIRLPKPQAEAFMDYHDSKGWKVGSQPMKDWKAAMRTWTRHFKERGGTLLPKESQIKGRLQTDMIAEHIAKHGPVPDFPDDGELIQKMLRGEA